MATLTQRTHVVEERTDRLDTVFAAFMARTDAAMARTDDSIARTDAAMARTDESIGRLERIIERREQEGAREREAAAREREKVRTAGQQDGRSRPRNLRRACGSRPNGPSGVGPLR